MPVLDLAGLAYRRGEDERLYLDSMLLLVLLSLGIVESFKWIFAVCALGWVDSELRRGGIGGAMPLV